ncbi:MAG: nicotinate (nicotinamide) nucleotide adenylyltransferase [Bacteroidota bacterium]
MKVGLFFGSFNPVHVGHMIIANYMVTHTDIDKVWMVVSPHNPHKKKSTLANDYERLHMVQVAIGDNLHIEASNIEFSLPKPSYTIDTLTYLKEKYPRKEFALIMGGDNLASLPRWKNYEMILQHHEIYVYRRPTYDLGTLADHPKVTIMDAPLLSISASYIRRCLQEEKSIQYLVPDAVYEYLSGSNLYRKKTTQD